LSKKQAKLSGTTKHTVKIVGFRMYPCFLKKANTSVCLHWHFC